MEYHSFVDLKITEKGNKMAYISTEDVKKIRVALKEEFGKKLKFGVRKTSYHSLNITIKSGEVDFSDLMRTPTEQVQVNHYHLHNYGDHKPLFEKIIEIIKTAPTKQWYDNSDSMIDHFDTAYYFSLRVGDWNKPYLRKEPK
jgi:hypothetical protein